MSAHTAETLERNIENELKESAGRPRDFRPGDSFLFNSPFLRPF